MVPYPSFDYNIGWWANKSRKFVSEADAEEFDRILGEGEALGVRLKGMVQGNRVI